MTDEREVKCVSQRGGKKWVRNKPALARGYKKRTEKEKVKSHFFLLILKEKEKEDG